MDITCKAKLFSKHKHTGQLDDIGLDYFETHIVQVVNILTQVTQDQEIIASAWLHDTIEDTETTYEELIKEFNKKIADLVMEVTHDGKADQKGFYFPRLSSKDAILIKFADRLSNLSRMGGWDEKRKLQYLKKSKFWKSE